MTAMNVLGREVLAAALLGYWGRPRNSRHGPAEWTPRQYEVMAEALEASGLPEQLRGAVDALLAAPMPERESIHKGEEWAERYGEWWHEHVRPHIIGGQ